MPWMQERSEAERRAIWPCLNVATWRRERSDRAIQQIRWNSTAFHSIPVIRSKGSTSVLSTRKIRPIYSHPDSAYWVSANWAYTPEYGSLPKPSLPNWANCPYLAHFAEKTRRTVPRIQQIGFRQTGHTPLLVFSLSTKLNGFKSLHIQSSQEYILRACLLINPKEGWLVVFYSCQHRFRVFHAEL